MWGGSPGDQPDISGYDIAQFSKFFTLHGLDFSLAYIEGKWEVTAWGGLTDWATYGSGLRDTANEAFLACYTAVRDNQESYPEELPF
jgi:hypothetical protein